MEVNLLGTQSGGQGGARSGRRALRRVLHQRGLRPVHPQGQGRRPDDDRAGRREPLGLRRQQARVGAPVLRPLQGGQAAARRSCGPFNVYGPRQVGDGAIRGMVVQALQNLPITLYNDGTQIRSWCFISDFVDGVLRCAERPEAIGHAFNLGNPQGTVTNFELANMIIRLTNSKSEIVFKPHPGPRSGPARAVDREGDVDARLPADGVARIRRRAGDPVVRATPRRDDGQERPDDGLMKRHRHRRVGIHRPQRAAACAARWDGRRAVSSHARARGVHRRARPHARPARALRSARTPTTSLTCAGELADRRTPCCISPPTAIRPPRPSVRDGISNPTRPRW